MNQNRNINVFPDLSKLLKTYNIPTKRPSHLSLGKSTVLENLIAGKSPLTSRFLTSLEGLPCVDHSVSDMTQGSDGLRPEGVGCHYGLSGTFTLCTTSTTGLRSETGPLDLTGPSVTSIQSPGGQTDSGEGSGTWFQR